MFVLDLPSHVPKPKRKFSMAIGFDESSDARPTPTALSGSGAGVPRTKVIKVGEKPQHPTCQDPQVLTVDAGTDGGRNARSLKQAKELAVGHRKEWQFRAR
jgi:hypothetical protein